MFLYMVVMVTSTTAFASDDCVSTPRPAGSVQLDLSLPGQFVDVCKEDATVCNSLTSGFPPSVSTLGYFVLPEEWKTFKKTTHGFSRYLIAQQALSLKPEDLPRFKQFLHSKQGAVPDHTSLVAVLKLRGRSPIGITSETPDSISFGTVMKLEVVPTSQEIFFASINSAISVRGQMLSLYVYDSVKDPSAITPLKTLSESWLACLRKNNPPPK